MRPTPVLVTFCALTLGMPFFVFNSQANAGPITFAVSLPPDVQVVSLPQLDPSLYPDTFNAIEIQILPFHGTAHLVANNDSGINGDIDVSFSIGVSVTAPDREPFAGGVSFSKTVNAGPGLVDLGVFTTDAGGGFSRGFRVTPAYIGKGTFDISLTGEYGVLINGTPSTGGQVSDFLAGGQISVTYLRVEVPEPSTLALGLLGLAIVGFAARLCRSPQSE